MKASVTASKHAPVEQNRL